MAADETLAILDRYLRKLLDAKLPVRGLVLYGSHARGDARPTSDIDVLVLLDDSVSDEDVFRLWPELDFLTHCIDSRIETWPVTTSRFQTDEVSPLVLTARREGVSIEPSTK
ncbi:nucleotidyltransferase domain-containing protein [Candidatus Sumerlaeota bacterium]|nr:nucleotidyltransferase domain-containing protein [Candidatus Sumerlaeota bacterium]